MFAKICEKYVKNPKYVIFRQKGLNMWKIFFTYSHKNTGSSHDMKRTKKGPKRTKGHQKRNQKGPKYSLSISKSAALIRIEEKSCYLITRARSSPPTPCGSTRLEASLLKNWRWAYQGGYSNNLTFKYHCTIIWKMTKKVKMVIFANSLTLINTVVLTQYVRNICSW